MITIEYHLPESAALPSEPVLTVRLPYDFILPDSDIPECEIEFNNEFIVIKQCTVDYEENSLLLTMFFSGDSNLSPGLNTFRIGPFHLVDEFFFFPANNAQSKVNEVLITLENGSDVFHSF